MSFASGVFYALAVLLGLAGVAKLRRPAGATRALDRLHPPGWNVVGQLPIARLLGVAEVIIAVSAVVNGGRAWAVVLTVVYLAFTAVCWRLAAGPDTDCGCFGVEGSPVSRVHVWVDVGFTASAAVTVIAPAEGIGADLAAGPAGLVLLAEVAVLVSLGFVLFTAFPELVAARRAATAKAGQHTASSVRPT